MTKVMSSSVTSPPSQPSSSRRRATINAKESTSEDQALNMIAKEAEARLAAKRAARAEARSIRMKEIEKKQKETGDDGGMSNDIDPLREGRYLTRAATLRGDEHITGASLVPAYDVLDTAANEKQILQLKETIKEGEEKYKKAMVNSAQLDNERQTLQYQVEVLKDIIEELQQRVENTDDELLHKTREHNKLVRDHNVTSAELKKCLFLVEERERILDEHGINIDGTMKEGYDTSETTPVQCSLCRASLDEDIDTIDDNPQGRESLLAEIASLKSEIEHLKQNNSEVSGRDIRHSNVSNDSEIVHGNVLSTELYTNNKKHVDSTPNGNDSPQFEVPLLKLSNATSIESLGNMDSKKSNYNANNVGGDAKSSLKINVDSYTDVDHTPTPSPTGSVTSTSNININNYLVGDYTDETSINDESEHYNAFRLSRYFDTDVSISSVDTNKPNDNKEIATSIDYVTDIQSNLDARTITNMQSSSRQIAVDEEIVTVKNIPLDMSSPDMVNPGHSIDEKPNISRDSEVNLYYQINTSTGEESDSINTSPDSSMNRAFCEEIADDMVQKLPGVQNETIAQIIRNDVEELYNQVADETNDRVETTTTTSNGNLHGDFFNPALPVAVTGSEHKGWKVWLESTLVEKKVKLPESSLVSTSDPTDSTEPTPEPKERKKKKKKKKKL